MDFNYGRFLNHDVANYLMQQHLKRKASSQSLELGDMDIRELTYCTDIAPIVTALFSDKGVPAGFAFEAIVLEDGRFASGVTEAPELTHVEQVFDAFSQAFVISARYGANSISSSESFFVIYFNDAVKGVESLIKEKGKEFGLKLKSLAKVVPFRRKGKQAPPKPIEQLKPDARANAELFDFIFMSVNEAYDEWIQANADIITEMLDIYRSKVPLSDDFAPENNIFQPTQSEAEKAFVVFSEDDVRSFRSRAVKTPLMEQVLSGEFLSKFDKKGL